MHKYFKIFKDYELMFKMSPDLAINSLKTYALSHGGQVIKPRLGKAYDEILLVPTKAGSKPEPKISVQDGTYKIFVENQEFEPLANEVTCLFTFVAIHFIFNLEMNKKISKKLDVLIKNYFSK